MFAGMCLDIFPCSLCNYLSKNLYNLKNILLNRRVNSSIHIP